MSPFQRFEPPSTHRRAEGPTVTITARASLNLSTEAVELLGGAAYVALLWDSGRPALALEPCSPNDAAAHRLLITRQARSVSAKKFLDEYGIDYSTARRWNAELDNGLLVVDLSQPGEEVTSNRAAVHSPAGAARVPPRSGARTPRR